MVPAEFPYHYRLLPRTRCRPLPACKTGGGLWRVPHCMGWTLLTPGQVPHARWEFLGATTHSHSIWVAGWGDASAFHSPIPLTGGCYQSGLLYEQTVEDDSGGSLDAEVLIRRPVGGGRPGRFTTTAVAPPPPPPPVHHAHTPPPFTCCAPLGSGGGHLLQILPAVGEQGDSIS